MPETESSSPISSPVKLGSWVRRGLTPEREFFCLSAMILGFGVLAWTSLKQKSVTFDEFVHLPAGLSYLRTGVFRIEPFNSPLIRMLAALPWEWSDVKLPLREGWKQANPWVMGYDFMYANADSYQQIYLRSRAVMVGLAALLLVLVWVWTRRLFGPRSALAAVLLTAFDPNFMAHAQLVTADVGGSLFFFGDVLAGWSFCRRPSWPRAGLVGAVLGLAILAKFTAVLLLPLLPLLAVSYRLTGGKNLSWRRMGLGLGLAFCVAWITICSCYGWKGFGAPVHHYTWQSRSLQRVAELLPPGLPLPLPAACLRGLDLVRAYQEESVQGYFLGEITNQTQPLYYLVALAVKTPLATLAMLLLGLLALGRAKKTDWPDLLFLSLPPVLVILYLSLFSDRNLGVRATLPALPFLAMIGSRLLAPAGLPLRRWVRGGLALLLAGTVASNLLIYPDYLAYFNCAAGGPSRGYRLLADSNLDWGQDLLGLKRYLDANGIDRICLAYFGRVDPAIYGIQYNFPRDFQQCDTLAVSVQLLLGFSYSLMDGKQLTENEPWQFNWLLQEKPLTTIGYSIWIFKKSDQGWPVP